MKNKGNKSGTFILFILFIIIALIVFLVNLIIAFSPSYIYSDPLVSKRNVRGTIYDRHGVALALDTLKPCFVISDSGRLMEISSFISPYTDLTALEISSLLSGGKETIPLSDEEGNEINRINEKILESGLEDQVKIEIRENRSYPYKSLSDIIGLSTSSHSATAGVEELFNDYLSALPTLGKETVNGEDIVLTIDAELEEILSSSMKGSLATAAILNSKDEIVAYSGPVTEGILKAVTYSHTTDNETILFLRSVHPLEGEKTDAYPYSIYLSPYDGNLIEKIKDNLRKNGKIS